MTFFIFFTTTASATFTTAAATSPSNQLIIEHFGSVDANSLCNLLNNNLDNDHVSDEPDILQLSSYCDDDSLNTLFTDKADSFSILSLNCQSLNAKFEQINIKIQQLQSKRYEFSAICLQETWLSDDSDISLLQIQGFNLIPQHKLCSAHGGLAIYIRSQFNCKTFNINILTL